MHTCMYVIEVLRMLRIAHKMETALYKNEKKAPFDFSESPLYSVSIQQFK